nr:39S ribosomal protein L23, mitochondrial [Megalopta genalis]
MSTRWYPLYQAGNPQLRIYLPNFWMKLIEYKKQPESVVTFHCSIEMTKYDVRNYLEKIYNVFPADVRTRIASGKTKRCPKYGCVIKDDDYKVAYISLKQGEKFTFPNLFPPQEEKSDEEQQEELLNEFKKYVEPNQMPGLPTWFRI